MTWNKRRLAMIVSVVCLSWGIIGWTSPAVANETVRVGLFMKTAKYADTTPMATLSARGGIVLSDDQGAIWETTDQAVQFSYDGQRIVVAVFSQWAQAKQLADTLRVKKAPVMVATERRGGSLQYTVSLGPYADRMTAEQAREVWAREMPKTVNTNQSIVGPIYAMGATYASEVDALKMAQTLNASLIPTAIAWVWNNQTKMYAVLIGGTTEAERDRWIVQASALFPIEWKPVPTTMRYAVVRTEQTGENGSFMRRVELSPTHRWFVTPQVGGEAILVLERFKRQYRGMIELTTHTGELAVVNVVPLESYIASVVGSEVDATWPIEAQKAQAVAARTYVLKQGAKYGIAQVSDTTFDQAYRGVERELPTTVTAAQQTAGWRLVRSDGTLQDAFYHSNAGNWTSDAREVWNTAVPGITPVPSPDDAAQTGKMSWYRIVNDAGIHGYVRNDLLRMLDGNKPSGWNQGQVLGASVNVRSAPFIAPDNIVGSLVKDARVTIIAEEAESTAYRWVRGPYDAQTLLQMMKNSKVASGEVQALGATLTDLQIVGRGEQSGRVTLVAANGKPLPVQRPDQYRTLLGLPSTRFDIEGTSSVVVQGSAGRKQTLQTLESVAVISATQSVATPIQEEAFLVTNVANAARIVTKTPQYRFIGYGFGHGLGMSQWGAYSLATLGYSVTEILRYYYPEATVQQGTTTK